MRFNQSHMPSESAHLVKGYGKKYEPSNAHAIHVEDDVYRKLAEQIRTECGYTEQKYPKVKVECERGDMLFTAEVDMALTFKEFKELWGVSSYLHAMAPCWTEFAAYNGDGDQIATDFNLTKFHKLLRITY